MGTTEQRKRTQINNVGLLFGHYSAKQMNLV